MPLVLTMGDQDQFFFFFATSSCLYFVVASQVKINCLDYINISLKLWLSLLEAHFSHLGITEEDKKICIVGVTWDRDIQCFGKHLCARFISLQFLVI